ncbi:MAG: tripartite tricarboxylate transporter TctB family protein [Clostridiales bacterium]|nr:tripartite tricarboxylate transporter TctB family protein [Clostridiales bacterium]
MKKSMPDVICSLVLLVFLTTLALQVPEIPEVSRTYPIFLLAVAYIMSFWLLFRSLGKLKGEEKQPTEVAAQTRIILPYCVMIAVYLFLMSRIGYIISTIVFMIASLIYLKLKNKVLMVLISVITTILIYLMFSNFLGVILPRASWFNLGF